MDREIEVDGWVIGSRRAGDGGRAQRPHRRRSVAAVLAAAAMVLSGCGLVGDDGPTAARVVVLGDSITFASVEELQERFADRDDELTVDARPGFTAEEVLDQARIVVDELGDAEAEQVIINVGTNDVLTEVEPGGTLDSITEMVELFPSARCVHLVTISHRIRDDEVPGLADRIEAVNELLENLADDRDDVRILDWNEVLDDPPDDLETADLLASDTVHTSPRGEAVLADAYITALDDCD